MKNFLLIIKLGLFFSIIIGFTGCINQSNIHVRPAQSKNMILTNEQKTAHQKLAQEILKYPKSQKGVKFQKLKDGFSINDDVYLDSEGEIVNYGYDWKDGSFTYLIKISPKEYKIKFNRVNSNQKPLEIATLKRDGNSINVETTTNEQFRGNGIILTSKGFIVNRDNSAFIFNIGEETKQFTTPSSWHIAYFQNGDVASTKFILLEKDAIRSQNKLKQFWQQTLDLGNTLGLYTKNDYMLINIENPKKKYLLNISIGDKEIMILSECKKHNRYIALCDQVDYKNSLYQQNGLRNFEHYYWSIMWFQGKNTNFSISKERGDVKVLIRDLNTGKTVEAANRISGFNSFTALQDADGIVKVHIDSGLLKGVDIDDVEAFLEKEPDIKSKE